MLAVYAVWRARRVRATTFNVMQFFHGLLPGQTPTRFAAGSESGRGVPYGVAIMLGGIAAVLLFRA